MYSRLLKQNMIKYREAMSVPEFTQSLMNVPDISIKQGLANIF